VNEGLREGLRQGEGASMWQAGSRHADTRMLPKCLQGMDQFHL
jgi:hypothetical protein